MSSDHKKCWTMLDSRWTMLDIAGHCWTCWTMLDIAECGIPGLNASHIHKQPFLSFKEPVQHFVLQINIASLYWPRLHYTLEELYNLNKRNIHGIIQHNPL